MAAAPTQRILAVVGAGHAEEIIRELQHRDGTADDEPAISYSFSYSD